MPDEANDDRELYRVVTRALDESGLPFQQAVKARAESLCGHGSHWEYIASEVPVTLRGAHTRIDLLLGERVSGENQHRRYMVIECKRVNPSYSRWLFAKAPFPRADCEGDTVLLDTLTHSPSPDDHRPTYVRLAQSRRSDRVFHIGVEAKGLKCGDSGGQTRGAIEDAVGQVLRGTGGLLNILASDTSLLPRFEFVTVVPVIVTTAELLVCTTDLAKTSIETGKVQLNDSEIETRPWLWYRYHRSSHLVPEQPRPWIDPALRTPSTLPQMLDNMHARTVAIVNYTGLEELLRKLFY